MIQKFWGSWRVESRDAALGSNRDQSRMTSKVTAEVWYGQCRRPENGEAHLVIEKMKKVIIKCSFAGSRHEGNGRWPGRPYALG